MLAENIIPRSSHLSTSLLGSQAVTAKRITYFCVVDVVRMLHLQTQSSLGSRHHSPAQVRFNDY